jgi:hypothetical protein
MTLLTQQENKDCGTQLFDEKKNIYQKSNAKLSQKISEYLASVSIFARSSGTAIEVNVLNFCIVYAPSFDGLL